MKRYEKDFTLGQEMMDIIASYMDDEIREDLSGDMAPCEPTDFLLAYLDRDPGFSDLLESEFNITVSDAEIIAAKIRQADTWDDKLSHDLCELAGLAEEYENADGDTFESVLFKAAKKLGVEIA